MSNWFLPIWLPYRHVHLVPVHIVLQLAEVLMTDLHNSYISNLWGCYNLIGPFKIHFSCENKLVNRIIDCITLYS